MSIPSTINITGIIYIKYLDDIISAKTGDIMLLLNNDVTALKYKNYNDTGFRGYIKAKIYDGKVWQNIYIDEFCLNKENKLLKKQRAIDSFLLCKAILQNNKGALLNRSYRGHFTIETYEKASDITKVNYARKQK